MGAGPLAFARATLLPAIAALASIAIPGAIPAAAAAADAEPVVYAQRGALWVVEGKAPAQKLGALPAELGAITSLQVDPAARIVLVGDVERWAWSPLRQDNGALGALAFRKLPCAPGPAQLSPDGAAVLCATANGSSMVVPLATARPILLPTPIEQIFLAGKGAELRLVWTDDRGVWTALLATPKAARQVAPEAPRGGFSVSPNGDRALGRFDGTAHHGKKVATQEMLFGFALDGKAARRKAIQQATALRWSADGKWVLVQDGQSACIMAATGGQYKCWKGYRGAAISRDGRYALLLGNRSESGSKDSKQAKGDKGKKDSDKGKKDGKLAKAEAKAEAKPVETKPARATHTAHTAGPASIDDIIDGIESGELGEGLEDGAPDDAGSLPGGEGSLDGGGGGEGGEGEAGHAPSDAAPSDTSGELHLYRASLEGAFTLPPQQLAPVVDGPASFAGTPPQPRS